MKGGKLAIAKNGMRVYSPCKGKVQDVKYVNDVVFSKCMMGVGFFVETNDKKICSPVEGVVEYIADTKHAIVIKKDNQSIMVHVGIDTCMLKGAPFKILVNEGDFVKLGQIIMEVDHKMIKKNKLNNDVIVVLIDNSNKTLLNNLPNKVHVGDVVIE